MSEYRTAHPLFRLVVLAGAVSLAWACGEGGPAAPPPSNQSPSFAGVWTGTGTDAQGTWTLAVSLEETSALVSGGEGTPVAGSFGGIDHASGTAVHGSLAGTLVGGDLQATTRSEGAPCELQLRLTLTLGGDELEGNYAGGRLCGRGEVSGVIGLERPADALPPARLAFGAEPTGVVAKEALAAPVVVSARDLLGRTVTSASGSVELEVLSATGVELTGSNVAELGSGSAAFRGIVFDRAGDDVRLRARTTGLIAATSGAFDVAPPLPAAAVFDPSPSGGTQNAPLDVVRVEVRDSDGAPLIGREIRVEIVLGIGSAAMLAGTVSRPTTEGAVEFDDLVIDRAGTFTLRALVLNADGTSVVEAESDPFEVGSAAAGLRFVDHPGSQPVDLAVFAAGYPLYPPIRVEIVDAAGARLNHYDRPIRLELGPGSPSVTLAGADGVTPVAGLATFDSVTIDQVGAGYTLRAVSEDFTVQSAPPFAVTAPGDLNTDGRVNACDLDLLLAHWGTDWPPADIDKNRVVDAQDLGILLSHDQGSELVFFTSPADGLAGDVILPAIEVELRDDGGRLACFNGAFRVSIGANPGNGDLVGTLEVAANDGRAVFEDLRIAQPGAGYTLAAEAIGEVSNQALTSAESDAFELRSKKEAADLNQDGRVNVCDLDVVFADWGRTDFPPSDIDQSGEVDSRDFGIVASQDQGSRLTFLAGPADGTAGNTLRPPASLEVRDDLGRMACFNGTLRMLIETNAGLAALSGTTELRAIEGSGAFDDLRFDQPGAGYTLRADAYGELSDVGMLSAHSEPFDLQSVAEASDLNDDGRVNVCDVDILLGDWGSTNRPPSDIDQSGLVDVMDLGIVLSHDEGSAVSFAIQPTNAAAGAAIDSAVQVELTDDFGPLACFTGTVRMAIGANPGAGTLRGITETDVAGGLATFGDLSIDQPGSGYTLVAEALAGTTGGSLLTAESQPFDVGGDGCSQGAGPFIVASSVSGSLLNSTPSDLYRVEASECGTDELIGLIRTSDGDEVFVADLARSPSGGLYGVSNSELYRIDAVTALAEHIGHLSGGGVVALAFAPDGTLYGATYPAFGIGNGNLIRIDAATAEVTVVGSLGSGFDADGDIAFAPDGTLYGAVSDGSLAYLARIDVETGTA